MKTAEPLNPTVLEDFRQARIKFELYEKFYLGLTKTAKAYLREQSAEYKKIVSDIQTIILPSVKTLCPACYPNCCRLSAPEKSVYIAGSVGCFSYVDYMLVRCETELPAPDYKNAENNLCPFSKQGCILPADCRSLTCIEYFCDKLLEEIDGKLIAKHVEKAKYIIRHFSTEDCMK